MKTSPCGYASTVMVERYGPLLKATRELSFTLLLRSPSFVVLPLARLG
jgi:hypothetical protein